MQLTHLLLLAGALTATAHPSGINHLHRSAHAQRREELQVHVKNVHKKPIPLPTTTEQAAPTTAPAVPTPPPSKDNNKGSNNNNNNDKEEPKSDKFIPFCGSKTGPVKSKRVTPEQVMYAGNLGTGNNCPWNSNMMVVPNSISDQYLYVQKYTNVASEPYEVICANKLGADGQLTGMFEVPGQEQLRFMLQPGETKSVVSDANTQGVCAFAPYKVPQTRFGQYAGVWAEFDFANESNGGWSGADCSSLVAQRYDMDVPGCRMAEGGVDSIILAGGIGENAYTKGMEELDGIGLNIYPGKTVVQVDVGYHR